MAAGRLPRAGHAPRAAGHAEPPRTGTRLAMAGRHAADVAEQV